MTITILRNQREIKNKLINDEEIKIKNVITFYFDYDIKTNIQNNNYLQLCYVIKHPTEKEQQEKYIKLYKNDSLTIDE